MKRMLPLLLSVLLPAVLWAQDFDAVYAKTEYGSQYGAKIYQGAVQPVWLDDDTFVYRTAEPGGDAWYRVSGGERTRIVKDAFEAATGASRRGGAPASGFDSRARRGVQAVSPDSTQVAFVRDNNVWISKPDGSEPCQLSFDGTDGEPYIRVQWSPDGTKLSAMKREVVPERQIQLRESRPADQVQPRYRYLDYAKPGDRLPQATPALFDVASRRQLPLDRPVPRDQYSLSLGRWSPDSKFFTFEYNQRGHQLYEYNAVDAATGVVRTLARETSNTFIYYNDLWRYLFSDGSRSLWISERDDWRHL